MSPRYAADTSVTPERSRSEIERTLERYGADSFAYGWEEGRAVIGFRAHGKYVRFSLPMPSRQAQEFRLTATGQVRSDNAAEEAWRKAVRQRWRALALMVKAKLEAVESGIVTFEEEFMAHLVLPDGRTTGEALLPQVEEAYELGTMPAGIAGLLGRGE